MTHGRAEAPEGCEKHIVNPRKAGNATKGQSATLQSSCKGITALPSVTPSPNEISKIY